MDYSKIYIELMERSFGRNIDGYVERHHIVPKCMGGDNHPRNIAILTPEEHFLAHQLLVKIYPKHYKLAFALHNMCIGNNRRDQKRNNNKLYGWHKKRVSQAQSKKDTTYLKIKTGEKNNFAKLTNLQASEIRKLYATGNFTHKQLGKIYNVSAYPIACIVNNKSYIK